MNRNSHLPAKQANYKSETQEFPVEIRNLCWKLCCILACTFLWVGAILEILTLGHVGSEFRSRPVHSMSYSRGYDKTRRETNKQCVDVILF